MQGCAASYSNATWCKQTFDGSCTYVQHIGCLLNSMSRRLFSAAANCETVLATHYWKRIPRVSCIGRPSLSHAVFVAPTQLRSLLHSNTLRRLSYALRVQSATPQFNASDWPGLQAWRFADSDKRRVWGDKGPVFSVSAGPATFM